jgi:hypothetical protein
MRSRHTSLAPAAHRPSLAPSDSLSVCLSLNLCGKRGRQMPAPNSIRWLRCGRGVRCAGPNARKVDNKCGTGLAPRGEAFIEVVGNKGRHPSETVDRCDTFSTRPPGRHDANRLPVRVPAPLFIEGRWSQRFLDRLVLFLFLFSFLFSSPS